MTEETLFQAALEKSPAERAAYLDQACAGKPELRAAVEALFAAHEKSHNVLDRPPGELDQTVDSEPGDPDHAATGEYTPQPDNAVAAPIAATTDYRGDAEPGTVIAGRYTLVEKLGEGGMGEVWVAKQTEPVKRKVALKLIKAGMDSRAVMQRFEQERQALALMDHPNIARVLDGGLTAERRPFFVMELVNGLPLNKFCDDAKLGIRERLELFTSICQAVQHAHQKGIIHRDLKPANILVTIVDGRGLPKVIDFGVAKATSGRLTDASLSTQFGAVVGTLEYMAPEQAGFAGEDIDTRADVYSLGVILYELLTGLRPIDAKRLKNAAITEMIRVIREEEPCKPSTRVSTDESAPSMAALRQTEPRKLTALLRRELDWVVLKCLEKPRDRRYETANALARDIQRYLADEPVEARPPSTGYRLNKFIRRHPLQLALVATIAVLLLGGGTGAWWLNEQASARREIDLRRQLDDEKRAAADNARLARNAEAVSALLGQCEESLRAGDLSKATVALEAAQKRSAEGGAENDASRLERLAADLDLLRELDAIDQFGWTWAENQFPDPAIAATRIREALRRFGADADATSVDNAISRIQASAVQDRIVTALDRQLWQEKSDAVRAVLRRVDTDPFRDGIRDAVRANDRAKIASLAAQDDALEQPAGFAAFLGDHEAILVERRRELLQAAVSRQPENVGLLMTMGNAYSNDNKDWMDERLRWFQAALAADPANVAALNDLGTALTDRNQVDAAILYYRKAIELDPRLGNAIGNMGNALYMKGQVDEAITWYRKAIEVAPNLAFAHDSLGVALEAKGLLDEAIESYRTAIEIDPHLPFVHDRLGTALEAKGQLDEAIVCYQKALVVNPNVASIHHKLGSALSKKGRMDESIASLRKAIELDPKLPGYWYNLGLALQAKGQVDEAIAVFGKAIEVDPMFINALGAQAVALRAKGQVDEAVVKFRNAIALDPNNARSHIGLGAILCDEKKDYDGAIACFKTAIELEPKSADAYMSLGVALAAKGQRDEAMACWRKTIELNPKHTTARYGLACGLASAAADEGDLANPRDPSERARLRLQALEALRDTLKLFAQLLEADSLAGRTAVQSTLRQLQQDANLASIRDAAALAKLPPEEQRAFTELWRNVTSLIKKAETPPPVAANTPDAGLLFLDETYKRQKAKLGPEHPETIRAGMELAQAYQRAGRLDLAVPSFEEVLKLANAHYGTEHIYTMAVKQNLAVAYWLTKQLDKSIPLFEEVLRFWEVSFGRDHLQTLSGVADLGINYKDAGRLTEAIPLLEEAQRAAKNHPTLRYVEPHLVDAYQQAGKTDLAISLSETAFKQANAQFGPGDLHTMTAANNLAVAYWHAKALDRSIPLFEEILKFRESSFGRDHLQTLSSVTDLGINYKDAGRLTEAIPLLEEAQRAAKNHPTIRYVKPHLIDAYRLAGRTDEAARLIDESIADARQQLPKDSPQLASMLAHFSLTRLQMNDFVAAEPLLRECLAIRQKHLPDDWSTFNTMSMLGGSLLGQNKHSDAEPMLLAGYEGMKQREDKIPPLGKVRLAESIERLVKLYEATEKPDEADRWRNELKSAKAATEPPPEKKP